MKRQYIRFHSKPLWLLIPAFWLIIACTAIAPPTVARDRIDDVDAMSASWKKLPMLDPD